MKVALSALEVSEGKKTYDSLLTEVQELGIIDVYDEKELFVTDDLDLLYEDYANSPGLRWRLRTLNEMLGSLRRGDFGFIFARPESGKTTFLASEVSFFAQQTDKPILWFNNEQDGKKVARRIYQSALGCSLQEMFGNREKHKELYASLTGNRIKIIDRARMDKYEVESICKQMQPALVVFDQLDKIKGFDADREDLRLGAIYIWARELAKEYCPVIGVCQADGTGEGKQWLTMENVSNAKTSKQAEADWILGIGKRNDQGYEYVRHLHLSKNKCDGDPDSIPELRHGRRDVIIDPICARYKDIE